MSREAIRPLSSWHRIFSLHRLCLLELLGETFILAQWGMLQAVEPYLRWLIWGLARKTRYPTSKSCSPDGLLLPYPLFHVID